MTQQIEVTAKLTFEANADLQDSFLKLFIEHFIKEAVNKENDIFVRKDMLLCMRSEILNIKEEAEIYGNT